jgi:tRNA A-37 threonylcarbamoyl transferase component Bud32
MAGRYREEFLLGTGGMAEVWRATGPLGTVAIKRLLPHAARKPSLAAAFEREGRLLQRILHPNVIGIHEIAHDERGTSLVLEYVDGTDLRALAGQPTPDRVALRVVRDLLRALEAVHGLTDETGRHLGIIHRDLSPSNVLVGINGRVKLTDFGIARAASGTHATTGTNVKGTLAYLSPEQATGSSVDARADLFAVGALLYEMLCGAPIYDEDDPRLALARARAGDVKSLAQARPETPFAIVEFVDRALSATPSDRFPNAELMRAEVEQVAERTCGLANDEELATWARSLSVMSGRGEGATPAASIETVVLKAPASKRTPIIAGVVLSVAVLGFGLRALQPRRAPAPAPRALAMGEAVPPEPTPIVTPVTTVPAAEPASSTEAPADRPVPAQAPERPRRAAPSDARPVAADVRPKASATTGEACLVDIGSEPAFAYVAIDGVKVGATPLFGRQVTPGTHRIQVWREGLGSKSFTLEVRPGDRISRVVKLP